MHYPGLSKHAIFLRSITMTQNLYLERLNEVLNHIDDHLGEPLSIADLAAVAHFSTFHFQRIFKALHQETPYEMISRRRCEKAVFLLKHHPEHKMQDLALDLGFGSAENFSRQFKQRYGFSPGTYKKDDQLQNSRIYQEKPEQDFHLAYEEGRKREMPDFQVEVLELSDLTVALKKAVFGEDGSLLVQAYEELMAWYESKGHHRTGSRRFGMSIDDPDVTPANHYRYDFAVAIDEDSTPEGAIERAVIPGGTYAVLACQGDLVRVAQAWDYLYRDWLPQSGYVPRHFPAIEEFLKGPEQIGWETFDLLCKIPIEKV